MYSTVFYYVTINVPDLDPDMEIPQFLDLPDPDPLVRGTDPDPFLSRKGVERTEIMLAKLNFKLNFLAKNLILIIKNSVKFLKLLNFFS